MKKTIIFAMLLATTTASAQFVHIELKNGTKHDFDSKDIKTMTVDTEAPQAPERGQIANHDYVTIGGKKWATMNIGATTVAGSGTVTTPYYIDDTYSNSTSNKVKSCFGTYFKWGETTATNGSYDFPIPNACDNEVLCSKHDVATVNWGSTWRTPTWEDFMALSYACSYTATPESLTAEIKEGGIYWLSAAQKHEPDYTGVAGILFVDREDPSKRVFFPAAGYVGGWKLQEGELYGYYLSSIPDSDTKYSKVMYFDSSNLSVYKAYSILMNNVGYSVRPVSD